MYYVISGIILIGAIACLISLINKSKFLQKIAIIAVFIGIIGVCTSSLISIFYTTNISEKESEYNVITYDAVNETYKFQKNNEIVTDTTKDKNIKIYEDASQEPKIITYVKYDKYTLSDKLIKFLGLGKNALKEKTANYSYELILPTEALKKGF